MFAKLLLARGPGAGSCCQTTRASQHKNMLLFHLWTLTGVRRMTFAAARYVNGMSVSCPAAVG